MEKIKKIANKVADLLKIDNKKLIVLIEEKEKTNKFIDIDEKDELLIKKIEDLLSNDDEIDKFGNLLTDPDIISNFNLLKENLGKLQILVLLKNLEKSNNYSEMLNSFITILNSKFENVNEILGTQEGGGTNINYLKYIKYKYKYYILKNII
jgi:hypothetical protein